jgi:AcrR family transcriptional regulator
MTGRRTEVMEAAYNLMGTQGLEAVHARTVAAKLGINHATVHYYFRTRPQLLAGVAEYALERLAADRKKVGEAANASETVENELALAEAYSRHNSRFAKVLLALTAAMPGAPELKEPLMTLWKAWRSPLEEAVPNAKFRRSSPYNDAETLAAQLFGLMASAHLTEGEVAVDQKLDQIFDSLFKA